jgi:predicted nucleic acid-binding protein
VPVKVLLDTNIIIHREATTVVKEDIGVLFRWLDRLHHIKCAHPITAEELEKHEDPRVRKAFKIKLANYVVLKTTAAVPPEVHRVCDPLDKNQNDLNDTLVINELYAGRVDALITEDRKLLTKASRLGVADRAFTIDAFLEKVTAENPELADYKVLAVQKDHLGNLDLSDDFFLSLKDDYPGFERWFNRKADETVYVCRSDGKLIALLYLKVEGEVEDYSDIDPPMPKKKRLKIGTFKVTLNGFRLGERFLKIVFDNALRFGAEELYVTAFDKRIEQQRLINLLEDYGFSLHGWKRGAGGNELVYVRSFARAANRPLPKLTYPFFSTAGRIFIVPIYPEYHTELFPDSILRTESPADFVENEPHRNAISKVYISRSIERDLVPGDVIVFYRTGGYYKSVVTTLGIVESVIHNIPTEEDFVRLCRKRSVFSDSELSRHWNYNRSNRPFIVNFLYAYSFPRRINLKRLIEIGVIKSVDDAPRGFTQIGRKQLTSIFRESKADESLVVY